MLIAFVDTPQRLERLTIFPVVSADEPELSYLLVADALRRGLLTLEETAPGEPPCLIAQNRGNLPVLILDCETVAGMGKHLGTNQSVLLAPNSVTRVPISCTDVGKWSCAEMEAELTDSYGHFPLLEHQVGVLAFLGQHLLGLDILGTPDLYSGLHRRLLTSYLVTAARAGERLRMEEPAEVSELEKLAKALESAERVASPCLGRGEYSTLRGRIAGG